jgi:hypothetical protein
MHKATHHDPPQRFVAWWRAHPHAKHGLPARVAYKCACYLDEYKAACILAPLLTTARPVPGAGRKAQQSMPVNEHNEQ